jgi:hypothetical protein
MDKPKSDGSIFFPIARAAMSRMISDELVSVGPLGSFNPKVEAEVKAINRQRKIESLIDNTEYKEMKPEEHPDYIKTTKGEIFYLDYVYGATGSNADTSSSGSGRTSKKIKK